MVKGTQSRSCLFDPHICTNDYFFMPHIEKWSTVPAGFCDHPQSEGLRSLNPARPLFLKEIWLKKVTFSTSNYKPLDIATSKRVDGRYFTSVF